MSEISYTTHKVKCDRCGLTVDGHHRGALPSGWGQISSPHHWEEVPSSVSYVSCPDFYDLCPACVAEFTDWWVD